MDIQDKVKEKFNESVAFMENLNLQLHLGKEEAKEEFEKQKKQLVDWSHDLEKKVSNAKHLSEEKATKLKTSLEELRVQAALGKAETEDTLKEQEKKISSKLHELQHDFDKFYDSSSDSISEFFAEASEKATQYRTRFDLFRLQFHLGKEEAKAAWEENRKDFEKKLHELKTKIEKEKEDGSKKWHHFTSELTESWNHFRNAFSSN